MLQATPYPKYHNNQFPQTIDSYPSYPIDYLKFKALLSGSYPDATSELFEKAYSRNDHVAMCEIM